MAQNMEDQLDEWRADETQVVTCPVTKEEFIGAISWFDNYNIALETEKGEVVLFKGNLAYIRPAT